MWYITRGVQLLKIHSEIFSIPCFNFQHVNIVLFHLLFLILLPMDFFCRNEVSVCRYRSTSMVCYCVAHQKLIDLSCAMHVTPCFSPAVFPSCFPSFPCCFIGFPSLPVLCTTVSAIMGISLRFCPLLYI